MSLQLIKLHRAMSLSLMFEEIDFDACRHEHSLPATGAGDLGARLAFRQLKLLPTSRAKNGDHRLGLPGTETNTGNSNTPLECYLNTSCQAARWSSSMNLDDRQFLQQVGFRIRELRLSRGLTQAQLAESCGLHRTFIGSVERGERNAAILSLRRIAKSLRVPLIDFVSGKQKIE